MRPSRRSKSPRAASRHARGWRIVRRIFRWCRIVVWSVILALLAAVVWVNQRGVPEVFQERIFAAFRERGIEIACSRLRVRWYQGLVADDLRLRPAGVTGGVRLRADEAVIMPGVLGWRNLHLRLDRVGIRGASIIVPAPSADGVNRELTITNADLQMHFIGEDEWEIARLSADGLGVRWRFSGRLQHPLELARRSGPPRAATKGPNEAWNRLLGRLQTIRLSPDAEVTVHVTGDCRRPETLRGTVSCSAGEFSSPEVGGRSLAASAEWQSNTNLQWSARLQLGAREVRSPVWGAARSLELSGFIAPDLDTLWPTNGQFTVRITDAQTRWLQAAEARLTGSLATLVPRHGSGVASELTLEMRRPVTEQAIADSISTRFVWEHSPTNPWPAFVDAAVISSNFVARPGHAGPLGRLSARRIEARLTTTVPASLRTNLASVRSPGWLDRLPGRLEMSVDGLVATNQVIDGLALDLDWRPPVLETRRLDLTLYGGSIRSTGRLDILTRQVDWQARTSCDPGPVIPLMDRYTQQFFSQFTWREPPHLTATARLQLPPWTNFAAGIVRALETNLWVAGRVTATNITFRGVPVTHAVSQVSFSNFVWHLPDLHVVRPDGVLDLKLRSNDLTHRHHWHFHTRIGPEPFMPLVPGEDARTGIGFFKFTTPPVFEGELEGNWIDPSELRLRTVVGITNFTFRGETVREFQATVQVTNGGITVLDAFVRRPEGVARVPWVWVDLRESLLHLSNAVAHIEPFPVARAIGDHVLQAIAPYRFADPPDTVVSGQIDLRLASNRNDLRFLVSGGAFSWKVFHPDRVAADIHWSGSDLTLSNVVGRMRGGDFEAGARFRFLTNGSADFRFGVQATNIDLPRLLSDIRPRHSNHVEGAISGQLLVTNANTDDLRTWAGLGRVNLTNGLIWDLPIMAVFSPVLNSFKAGLGNNRAREAQATFLITNTYITTGDLAIHTDQARLQFAGSVDFDMRVDGSMEAQILRDTKGVGGLVSAVLWPVQKLFAYKITGTLDTPKTRPLHIPTRILLAPFRPIRTFKELFGIGEEPRPAGAP